MDVLGKNGLHIRIQQEKSYQNDKLFYLGFEKVIKIAGQCYLVDTRSHLYACTKGSQWLLNFAEMTHFGSMQIMTLHEDL